jgi:o-succinylbenzoate---CoA ligase
VEPDTAAGLRPVHGSAAEVYDLLTNWLTATEAEPLTVRTSGSTGRAREVLLSSVAVRASAAATLRSLGGPGQWLLALPVSRVAGLQVITRSVLASIQPVPLHDFGRLAAATRSLTGDRRYVSCVPTQLYRWLADDEDRSVLSSYDAVLVGGAATAPALLRQARDAGISVITTYGMTETCGGCVYDGLPLDGAATTIGAGGEIRIAGPMLFDGYVDDAAGTAEVLHDGWFQTGDLGEIDIDGRLLVTGRVDDTVMSGGVAVSLPAVERRLEQMRGVEAACVVGRPDPEWGTRVVAYIVPGLGAQLGLDSARDFVGEELPRTWAPRELVVVDALPMLESGKPDRQALHDGAVGTLRPERVP